MTSSLRWIVLFPVVPEEPGEERRPVFGDAQAADEAGVFSDGAGLMSVGIASTVACILW